MARFGSSVDIQSVRWLGVVLLVAATPLAAMGQPRIGYHLGDVAPKLTLTDQNGNSVSLSDSLGKNVLMTFSAAWCGPCQYAAPQEEQVVNTLNRKGEPTQLLEVLVEDIFGYASQMQDAQDWADQFGISSPVLSVDGDPNSPGVKQFFSYSRLHGGPAFPTAVLLTPHGRIINVYVGFSPSLVATDFSKNRSYEPRCMVDRLQSVVEGLALPPDLAGSLGDQLQAILASLDARDSTAACDGLGAFVNAVQSQAGTGLPADRAAQLTDGATSIRAKLGCQ